jgi:hypothetical protein
MPDFASIRKRYQLRTKTVYSQQKMSSPDFQDMLRITKTVYEYTKTTCKSYPYHHVFDIEHSQGSRGVTNICIVTDAEFSVTLETGGQDIDTWHSFMSTTSVEGGRRHVPFTITSGRNVLPFLHFHEHRLKLCMDRPASCSVEYDVVRMDDFHLPIVQHQHVHLTLEADRTPPKWYLSGKIHELYLRFNAEVDVGSVELILNGKSHDLQFLSMGSTLWRLPLKDDDDDDDDELLINFSSIDDLRLEVLPKMISGTVHLWAMTANKMMFASGMGGLSFCYHLNT